MTSNAIRKAAFGVIAATLAIMGVGFGTSYATMATFLRSHSMEEWAALAIPATVDLLALSATVTRFLLPTGEGRTYATRVAVTTVTVSITANVGGSIARAGLGWDGLIAGLGHGWPIVAYLLGEGLVTRLLTYAASLELPVVVADDAVAPELPEAPTSPAPTGRKYSERHERRLRTGR